jgi:hypothetical protein
MKNVFFDFLSAFLVFFFKSAVKVLSSWYEELKVANSAFHSVGWQRQTVRGHGRCHCA